MRSTQKVKKTKQYQSKTNTVRAIMIHYEHKKDPSTDRWIS